MINLKILSWYFIRSYCKYFFIILFLLTGILIISNVFDILQKFKNSYIPFPFFLRLIFYKIPYLLNQVAPIISFSAMLFFLRNLIKSNELIAILANGIHLWQVLITPGIVTLILGIILIVIFNAIGAIGIQKYELLEAKLLKQNPHEAITSKSSLLFFETLNNENKIILIHSINIHENRLDNISILFINNDNSFLKRIDAQYAIVDNNKLLLEQTKIFDGTNTITQDHLVIPTNLSINGLIKKFTPPETVSIWQLPTLITELYNSGVPIINYHVYYYKQLFKPIMMFTMVALASCFVNLNYRNNSQEKILIIGLLTGFIVFSLSEILLKILANNNLSLIIAVLLPSMLIFFISNFIILHYKKI